MYYENRVVLVTGGAGFIGSALVRYLIDDIGATVINVDKLTYAGNLKSLVSVASNPKYTFHQADICDTSQIRVLFSKYKPNIVMHLAAESHVDRSIDGPGEFISTNVTGTYTMLEVAREYWVNMDENSKPDFRFHHISTDEVYGSLGTEGLFTEETPYDPSSPYSASKASSDHLVRAWHRTYGLPVVITNCSNNYGPYQFPEKLIPLMILNALQGEALPIYGKGNQIRDWLYVDDHVRALWKVVTDGRLGETYNIGGFNELTNLEVVHTLCRILDERCLDHLGSINKFEELITYVADRPGHDQRYAIDASKIEKELGWHPSETFETGFSKTVDWYLANGEWCQHVQDGSYRGERLGTVEEVL